MTSKKHQLLSGNLPLNFSFSTGAPDPTAGGCISDSSTWYFDESGVREQLRVDLAGLAAYGANGCTAFDMSPSQTSTVSNATSYTTLSSAYGRLFTNGSHSDHHRRRYNRFSGRYYTDEATNTEETGCKPRNFSKFCLTSTVDSLYPNYYWLASLGREDWVDCCPLPSPSPTISPPLLSLAPSLSMCVCVLMQDHWNWFD